WVDTLPDIKLVQRNFSGHIDPHASVIGKVEAVLFGTGVPQEHPIVTEFFYNKSVEEYSGFVYFPVSGKEAAYFIYVDIFDAQGFLIGRSDTVAFNGLAGNLTIPTFSAENVKLRAILGEDTLVPLGAEVVIHGSATTPPGSEVVEAAWKLGLDGAFQVGEIGKFLFTSPLINDSASFVIVRVKNDKGAVAYDSLEVRTGPLFNPEQGADAGVDITVPPGTRVTLKATAYPAPRRKAAEFAWKLGSEKVFTPDSDGVVQFTAPDSYEAEAMNILRITDDMGAVVYDTMFVRTGPLSDPELLADAGSDTTFAPGATVSLKGKAVAGLETMIAEYAWKIQPDSVFTIAENAFVTFVAPAVGDFQFQAILRVKNNIGSIAFDTVELRTETHFDSLLRRPWAVATHESGLPASDSWQALEFQGKIWAFNQSFNNQEIWKSEDGKTWSQVIASPAYQYKTDPDRPSRYLPTQHGTGVVVAFHDKLWVLGGNWNEAWSSSNGIDWTLEADASHFLPRDFSAHMQAVVSQDKLWVISDQGCWTSSDGKGWELMTACMDAITQGMLPVATQTIDGKVWFIGENYQDYSYVLLTSESGRDWDRLQLVVPDYTIGVLGGALLDIYRSVQMDSRMILISPTQTSYLDKAGKLHTFLDNRPDIFGRMSRSAVVVFKGKIFLLGGHDQFGNPLKAVLYWGMD
ncbi:MAG: hypothetical protein ABI036_17575, partial [Fibrobacteria bacterium]